MIEDTSQFIKLKSKDSGKATFGDDKNATTFGIGDIGKNGETFIQNMLPVDNLGYNLLSVSQLCDRDLYMLFKKFECLILDVSFNIIFKEKKIQWYLYSLSSKDWEFQNQMFQSI